MNGRYLKILRQVQNKRKHLGIQTIIESSIENHRDTNRMAEVFKGIFAAQIRTHVITLEEIMGKLPPGHVYVDWRARHVSYLRKGSIEQAKLKQWCGK